MIDADVEFFENRIKQYEELLRIEHNENWWNGDMNIKQLEKYFNRTTFSIRKMIRRMCNSRFKEYKYLVNDKVVITSKSVEWICKNVFKQKYLELLKQYRMKLTEKYIETGHPYDNFFEKINCKYLEVLVEEKVVL